MSIGPIFQHIESKLSLPSLEQNFSNHPQPLGTTFQTRGLTIHGWQLAVQKPSNPKRCTDRDHRGE